MQSVSDIWSMILTRLREDLSETTIKTWFDETAVVALEGNNLYLHCPNTFKRTNIQDRFLPNIESGLKDIFSADIAVHLLDDNGLQRFQSKEEEKPVSLMESGEFTFDTFVVGPSNRLACSAARAVADAPGQHYNPLFIYGDSGLGKTHLLYAIAHVIRGKFPSAKILYIKGDEFINDYIETVRSGRAMNEFRTKYREADLMLVDDIQFVAGKVETQNEFFHTFNALYEAKKQIVLTSDRPPQEMAQLDDRLRTRFEWGLMVDVQPPDLETRIAILKNKAVQLGFLLSDDIAAYIASKITANVRQMEGTVKSLQRPGRHGGGQSRRGPGHPGYEQVQRVRHHTGEHHRRDLPLLPHRRDPDQGAVQKPGLPQRPADRHVPHPPHDQPLPQRHRKPLRRPGPRHSHQLYLQSRKKDEVRPRLRRNGQGHHHQYQLHQMTPVKNHLAYNTGVSTFSTRFSTI